MATLKNRVGVHTSTHGNGNIALGAALQAGIAPYASSWQSFSQAGLTTGQIVRYLVLDANGAWEYGPGTYDSTGILSRPIGAMNGTVAGQKSSTGSLLSLTGLAQVFISATVEDLVTGPAASTMAGLARFADTTGGVLADSPVLLGVAGNMRFPSGGSVTFTDGTPSTLFDPLTIRLFGRSVSGTMHIWTRDWQGNEVDLSALTSPAALNVTFSPIGGLSSTNVQAAIAELDIEKASIASLSSIAFSGVIYDVVGLASVGTTERVLMGGLGAPHWSTYTMPTAIPVTGAGSVMITGGTSGVIFTDVPNPPHPSVFTLNAVGSASWTSTVTLGRNLDVEEPDPPESAFVALQNGDGGGFVTMRPPAGTAGYNWIFPTTAGTAGQYLTSQGGTLPMTWTTGSGGGGVSDGDKGDITVSGGGATWTIDASAVTYAKIQNMTAARLLGRGATGTGAPQEIVLGTGLSFTTTTVNIDTNAITYAKMQDVTATSRFIGRITAGAGDPEELTGTQATTLLDVFTPTLKGLVPTGSGGVATNFLRGDGTWGVATGSGTPTSRILTAGAGMTGGGDLTVDRTFNVIGSTSIIVGADDVQRAALTGDVTAAQNVNATVIANDAVTYAKMQNVSAISKLLGRGDTGAPADVQEITLGTNLTMSGTTLNAAGGAGVTDGDKTDITVSGSGATWVIDNNVVSYAKMQDVTAASKLLGRGDSGAGDPQEITLGTNLTMSGTTLNASVTGGGGGDVVGPVSATNLSLAVFSGTTGKLLVDSAGATGYSLAGSLVIGSGSQNLQVNPGGAGLWINYANSGVSYFDQDTLNFRTVAAVPMADMTSTRLALSQTTASTSTTTGALTVGGGVGISGALYIGGGLGATIMEVTGTDFCTLILRAGPPHGQLVTIKPRDPTYGTCSFTGAGGYRFDSTVTVSDATASTSTTTGALIVTGGVGIGGRANIGGIITVAAGSAGTPALGTSGVDNGIFFFGGHTRIASNGAQTVSFEANSSPNIHVSSTGGLKWNSAFDFTGVPDVALARAAAGVLEVNNGTAGTLTALYTSVHTINATGGALPTPNVGTMLHVSAANDGLTKILIDAFGVGTPQFLFRRAMGSFAVPSQMTVDQPFGQITSSGYQSGGAYTTGTRGGLSISAGEAWTATNQGSYITLLTTANGTAVNATESMRVWGHKGVTMGAAAMADPGATNLVVAGSITGLRLIENEVTLTDGATVALDAGLGNTFKLLAAGDRTISVPTNKPASGKVQKIVIMHEASAANRILTLTTGSAGAFRFGTDITALTTTTSGLVDYIGCVYNDADDRWDVVSYSKGY